MQAKTIRKAIENKLNDWLDTISDENLKRDVKGNILVSGGSITSMLLNEPVNDYDIYINDVDVLVRLAEYYTKGAGVEILKGWEKEQLLESYKFAIKKDGKDVLNQFTIAVNNLKENQIKIFIKDDAGKRMNEGASEEEQKKYIPMYLSPNAISLSNQLQIVIRFHGNNVEIHKTFDFMHATNYFTFEAGLVLNTEALTSILTKQLSYQGSLYPLTSIIRMKKFIIRGWSINAGEILKIMFQISELDLTDPNVLEEQLVGVDVAYFDMLIKLLRGVKKHEITSSYMNKIINKVFNES